MKKDFGGLGIPNIKDVKMCLLASWLKRYIADDGKIWKTIVDHKYRTSSPNILPVTLLTPLGFGRECYK